MDMTALATQLLEPIAIHRTLGLRVVRAQDGVGEVELTVTDPLTNVVGSLHSSGLVAMVDAAGLAAIIGAAHDATEFADTTPLGTVAELEFIAPARGVLTGHCTLDEVSRARLRALLDRDVARTQLVTDAEILAADGTLVCSGTFTWKLRRAAVPRTVNGVSR